MDNGRPRNTRAILVGALHELQEREDRLTPFVAEIDEVRRGIKVLEKALGDSKPTKPKPAWAAEPGAMKDLILAALRGSMDPLSKDDLRDRLGGLRGRPGGAQGTGRERRRDRGRVRRRPQLRAAGAGRGRGGGRVRDLADTAGGAAASATGAAFPGAAAAVARPQP